MELWTWGSFEAAVSASPIHIRRPLKIREPSLYSLVGTLGLRGALNRALGGPIFRYVSGLESFEYGIVDVEVIGGGCICVPDTHTEALDDPGVLCGLGDGTRSLSRSTELVLRFNSAGHMWESEMLPVECIMV